MIKKIAFDVDGTITDDIEYTVAKFRESYIEKFNKPYTGRIDYSKYVLTERFPDCDKSFVENWAWNFWDYNIIHGETPIRPHIAQLTKALHKKGIEIHIITARGSDPRYNTTVGYEEKEKATKKFLTKNGIYFDVLHFGCSDKLATMQSTGCEILVDDKPSQILKVSDKYPVFVVDTPYNKLVKGLNIWRLGHKDDFSPEIFLKKIEYVQNHSEMYVESMDDVFFEETEEANYIITDNQITFHADELKNILEKKSKKNIIFVMSARQRNTDLEYESLDLAKTAKKNHRRVSVVRLSRLLGFDGAKDKHPVEEVEAGDALIGSIRANVKKPKNDTIDSTDRYQYNMKLIKEVLKYAEKHKDTLFIIDGFELMILPRGDVEKYKDYPTIITKCDEKDFGIIRKKQHKKDYNQFLLLEDLTDTSTQLRKWRIIAGTAPKELDGYINRQYADSNGVDCVHLLPGEKPYHPERLDFIISMDTYVIGDLHFSTKDPEKTKNIIRNINSRVGKNDHLLIVGDLDGKKGTGSWDLCKKALSSLNTKNLYFILGNNDPYTIEKYVKMGFLTVTDIATFQPSPDQKVILTHCPYPVDRGEVNIHGHIHGSRCYWNLDWHDHYDVWDQDFYPTKIGECLEILEKGLYHAVSENHRNY
jgi:uncharacterized HAD superfamily protein/calcineurin-like phosphoesterase family protein